MTAKDGGAAFPLVVQCVANGMTMRQFYYVV